jgi:hypothetical protein
MACCTVCMVSAEKQAATPAPFYLSKTSFIEKKTHGCRRSFCNLLQFFNRIRDRMKHASIHVFKLKKVIFKVSYKTIQS